MEEEGPVTSGSGRAGGTGSRSSGTPKVANFPDLDHYDFINAPQYVDFCDMEQTDDPNAELFFETHKEEDDFVISIDNISPTVQLLTEQQNLLNTIQNEVNDSAAKGGMDDVKVTYYASPKATANNKNKSGTSGRKTASLNSTIGLSFHTPIGEDPGSFEFGDEDGDNNKENLKLTLSPSSFFTADPVDDTLESQGQEGKKLSYSAALGDKTVTPTTKESPKIHTNEGQIEQNPIPTPNQNKKKLLRKSTQESLIAQLDKLQILSSDEEDDIAESVNEDCSVSLLMSTSDGYQSPTKSPITTDESLVESLLKTPGAIPSKLQSRFKLMNSQRLDFFEGLSISSPSVPVPPLPPQYQDEETQDKNKETFFKNEFPVFQGPRPVDWHGGDDRKLSFLVEPSVGKEIVWNNEGETATATAPDYSALGACALPLQEGNDETFQVSILEQELQQEMDRYANAESDCELDSTLTSSFDSYQVGNANVMNKEQEEPMSSGIRRSSSLSDLEAIHSVQNYQHQPQPVSEPRNPIKTLNGKPLKPWNKAMGGFGVGKLTIPQSPDASKRVPSKCRSQVKPLTIVPTSTSQKNRGRASVSNNPSIPSVPYKGAVGGSRHLPLKANHYVSLAEAVTKFQKNTPDRFRTLPKGVVPQLKRSVSCEVKPGGNQNYHTRPKSPSPQRTQHRSRADTASRKSVHSSTEAEVKPKVSKTTIPQPFNFATLRPRAATLEKKDEFKFKARPAPKITPAPAVGVGSGVPRPVAKVTQAIAPHFASDDRIRERNVKKAQSASQSPTATRSNSQFAFNQHQPHLRSRIPTSSATATNSTNTIRGIQPPPAPLVQEHKTTAMKPFSFDQRNQEMLRRKEEKIKQEIEEHHKIREFHANPLPQFELKLPKKKTIQPTHVEPFNLTSGQRGSAYQDALRKKLLEEERRHKELSTFHANLAVVLHHPAFEPDHPPRPPLETMDFQLNTEKRAVEREHFDQYLRQKEIEEGEFRREEQERLEEQQKHEEMERRRQIVHKAIPFRVPKPFEVRASKKKLTVPQSPLFNPLPSQRQRRFTPTPETKLKEKPQPDTTL